MKGTSPGQHHPRIQINTDIKESALGKHKGPQLSPEAAQSQGK